MKSCKSCRSESVLMWTARLVLFCVSAAAESEWGESLHRECGQEADHHGPADQVGFSPELPSPIFIPMTPKVVKQSWNETTTKTHVGQNVVVSIVLPDYPWCCSCIRIILCLFKYIIWLNCEVLTHILDHRFSFVGNTEIDVDIKKYYCRAGIKSIQASFLMFRWLFSGGNVSVLHQASCLTTVKDLSRDKWRFFHQVIKMSHLPELAEKRNVTTTSLWKISPSDQNHCVTRKFDLVPLFVDVDGLNKDQKKLQLQHDVSLTQNSPRRSDHDHYVTTWPLLWQIYIKCWPRPDKGDAVHSCGERIGPYLLIGEQRKWVERLKGCVDWVFALPAPNQCCWVQFDYPQKNLKKYQQWICFLVLQPF